MTRPPGNLTGIRRMQVIAELSERFKFNPRKTLHGKFQAVKEYHEANPDIALSVVCEAAGVSHTSYRYHFYKAKKTLNETSESRKRLLKIIEYCCPDKNALINQNALQRRLYREGAPVSKTTLRDILVKAGYRIGTDALPTAEGPNASTGHTNTPNPLRKLFIMKIRRECELPPDTPLPARLETIRKYKESHPTYSWDLLCEAVGVEFTSEVFKQLQPNACKAKRGVARRAFLIREIKRHVCSKDRLVHPTALRRRLHEDGVNVSLSTLGKILKEEGYVLPMSAQGRAIRRARISESLIPSPEQKNPQPT